MSGKNVHFAFLFGDAIFRLGPYTGERVKDVIEEDLGYVKGLLTARLSADDREVLECELVRAGVREGSEDLRSDVDALPGVNVRPDGSAYVEVGNSRSPNRGMAKDTIDLREALSSVFGGSKGGTR